MHVRETNAVYRGTHNFSTRRRLAFNKPGESARVVGIRRVSKQPKTHPLPPDNDLFQAAASGDPEWLQKSLRSALSPKLVDKQGLTVLHVACLYGQLACIKLLLETQVVAVNTSCPQGRRPIHMVLTARSRPHSHTCLTLLLEHGALPNVATHSGVRPLHVAVTEGLLDCTQALLNAGADTWARDSRGHTPLDLARIWGHRRVARYLKYFMWQQDKKTETERRKDLAILHHDLVDMYNINTSREKVIRQDLTEEIITKWADRKGLPRLRTPPRVPLCYQAHTRCLSPDQGRPTPGKGRVCKASPGALPPQEPWNISPNPSMPPTASVSRSQGVRMSSQPEKTPPEPDLQKSVTLGKTRDGRPLYMTKWDESPHPAPSLPMDVLRRGLFPNVYPARIASAGQFHPQHVLDLPRRGCAPGHSTSPWTEVAMHLVEELEPGHY